MAEDTTSKIEADSEVKGTLLSADQVSEWGNERVFVEPGDATTSEAQELPETPAAPNPPVEAPIVPEEPEEPVVAPPGDFAPRDYSFEVTYYDPEGKNAKTIKINSVEEWDKLVDQDINLGTTGSATRALRAATKMELGLEADRRAYQEQVDEYNQYTQAQSTRTETVSNMMAEMTYLVNKGELPPIAAEYRDADWSDPEVAKQSGVKEQVALLNYMVKENAARTKAGVQPLRSVVDAYNSYQLDESKQQAASRRTQAGTERRAAGARVAGNSPAPVTTAPKGIAIGRVGEAAAAGTDWST